MIFKRTLYRNLANLYNKSAQKMSSNTKFDLKNIVTKLEEFAPIKYAETWDNVGLLIEPYTPTEIKTILLTNDLTEEVFNEAESKGANLIISYHPPIFAAMKRITQNTWKERLVSMCLEKRIALYSPHTAWDVAKNGVGDWLASLLRGTSSEPIQKNAEDGSIGVGRVVEIESRSTLRSLITNIKNPTKLEHIHVAVGKNCTLETEIKTAAVCPGSGSSVLKDIKADLYLTGEMSHHEIQDATQRSVNVILLNHSNSERGYLHQFAKI